MRPGDRPADSSAAADSTAARDGAAAGDAAGGGGAVTRDAVTGDAVTGDDALGGDGTVGADGGDGAVGRDGALGGDGTVGGDSAIGRDSALGGDGGDGALGGDGAVGGDGAIGRDSAGTEEIAVANDGDAAKDSGAAKARRTDAARTAGLVKTRGSGLAIMSRRVGRIAAGVRRPAGGTAFAWLTTLPAILVMAWLVPGLPLLLVGAFVPAAMLLISAPLAVLLAVNGLGRVPARWPRELPGPDHRRQRTAWWGLAGTVVVAVGFAAWQLAANSPSVIVRRDPGAYLQAGYWIAQHGSLAIPRSLTAFGGPHPGLSFSSIGFFPDGGVIAPTSASGLPMLVAGGFWIHGLAAAAAMSPVLGALAVLAFGGLVGRLAGPQWAPAGALVLAFTLPEQYTSRSAFSEPLTQVLLLGGLSLLIDSLTLDGARGASGKAAGARGLLRWLRPASVLAALAGLALGLIAAVQVSGLLYLLPVIPFVGVLIAGRRAQAVSYSAGLIVGVGYGIADWYLESRPYMGTIARPLEQAGLAAAGLVVLTAAVVLLVRSARVCRRLRKVAGMRPVRWLPGVAGVVCAAALAGFAARPYVQVVRGHPNPATAAFVAALQRVQHLPVDPTRLYAEDTLYWVIWYIGAPAVLLGGLGLALLARRTVRALLTWRDTAGAARNWGLPLAIIVGGMAAVLWRPGTVPDQPWASRRLVPVVLPGLILCAIWASAWLVGRARDRGAGPAAWSLAGACCVAALLVPTVVTTFGVALTHSGKSGSLRPVADGLALKRTGAGEAAAVRELCAAIGSGASVVIIDQRVARQFTQVIRGMCGVPAGWMPGSSAANVRGVVDGISRAGRRPVLLAGRRPELAPYGSQPLKVLDLRTTQDSQELTQPPTAPRRLHYVIWLAAPTAQSVGA